jgi:hypothetical protein
MSIYKRKVCDGLIIVFDKLQLMSIYKRKVCDGLIIVFDKFNNKVFVFFNYNKNTNKGLL